MAGISVAMVRNDMSMWVVEHTAKDALRTKCVEVKKDRQGWYCIRRQLSPHKQRRIAMLCESDSEQTQFCSQDHCILYFLLLAVDLCGYAQFSSLHIPLCYCSLLLRRQKENRIRMITCTLQ